MLGYVRLSGRTCADIARQVRGLLSVSALRVIRDGAAIVAAAAALCVAACNGGEQRATKDSVATAGAADHAPIDPVGALGLERYFTENGFRLVGGSCIKTDPDPGRSRIIYAILPGESTYVRLNVVALDSRRVDMIELVRGVTGGGGGRIWTAITHARGGQLGPVVTELFASASDKAPATSEVPVDGPAGQLLQNIATAAMKLPCVTP